MAQFSRVDMTHGIQIKKKNVSITESGAMHLFTQHMEKALLDAFDSMTYRSSY